MKKLRVFILDDDRDALDRLGHFLKHSTSVQLVGSETNPENAIPVILSQKPEIILLDIEMPYKDGFEVLDEVRSEHYKPGVIFVTGYDKYAIQAIKAAAFDYILKPVAPDELDAALERVKQSGQKNPGRPQLDTSALSKRELEIFELLRSGKDSREIGSILNISKHTVDTHRRKILRKLNIRSTKDILLDS